MEKLLFQFLSGLNYPIIDRLYLAPLSRGGGICHNATYTTITIKVTWPLQVYLPSASADGLQVVSLFWLQPHFSLK